MVNTYVSTELDAVTADVVDTGDVAGRPPERASLQSGSTRPAPAMVSTAGLDGKQLAAAVTTGEKLRSLRPGPAGPGHRDDGHGRRHRGRTLTHHVGPRILPTDTGNVWRRPTRAQHFRETSGARVTDPHSRTGQRR